MRLSLVVLMLIPAIILSQHKNIGNSSISYNDIEASYLMGLSSDNLGLKVSSAYFLGEIESQEAVIPLMRMLRSSESQEERLIAALSLIKIGDARGIYLVKERAEFCDCKRTRRLCNNLYLAYNNSKYEEKMDYALEGDGQFLQMLAGITN